MKEGLNRGLLGSEIDPGAEQRLLNDLLARLLALEKLKDGSCADA